MACIELFLCNVSRSPLLPQNGSIYSYIYIKYLFPAARAILPCGVTWNTRFGSTSIRVHALYVVYYPRPRFHGALLCRCYSAALGGFRDRAGLSPQTLNISPPGQKGLTSSCIWASKTTTCSNPADASPLHYSFNSGTSGSLLQVLKAKQKDPS